MAAGMNFFNVLVKHTAVVKVKAKYMFTAVEFYFQVKV